MTPAPGSKKPQIVQKMFKRLIKATEFSISSDQNVLSQPAVEVLTWKNTTRAGRTMQHPI